MSINNINKFVIRLFFPSREISDESSKNGEPKQIIVEKSFLEIYDFVSLLSNYIE